jgi:glycosyltransferase involved in cell wall biosynthesis
MLTKSERHRLSVLLDALSSDTLAETAGEDAYLLKLAPFFEGAPTDRVWLALSVLRAEFPDSPAVVDAAREIRLRGAVSTLRKMLKSPARRGVLGQLGVRPVRVVTGATVVDVHHTARTGLATGIQRVVRKTIEQWDKSHELVLVGWGSTYGGLRELSPMERANALYGNNPHAPHPKSGEVTIPWRSSYILPELAVEDERTKRIQALAEYSGNASYAIGFDCVPLTTAETTGVGMGGAFAKNLAAVARFDKVATISQAAAIEYSGWRRMLAGAGLSGPDVREVFLPADAGHVTGAQLDEARATLITDGMPMLLCVGSHEPRKNHLAVLTAAEMLWREGREFSLAFVGGNSWGSAGFTAQLTQLKKAGRPVQSISAISDELLWSAYRLAQCSVFPSLNEGFGLPVAESLAVGTPVVTSDYGSMKEICASGGAILVDPRDDHDLVRGLRSAMFDHEVNARLRAEADARPERDWAMYAIEVWDYFFSKP